MSDIHTKALELAVYIQHGNGNVRTPPNAMLQSSLWEALCRVIEQLEAFKQEVSDDVSAKWKKPPVRFRRYVIPKTDLPVDPLVEAWIEATGNTVGMDLLNDALKARGLEIVPCK
jgi:hypothetical protein